MSTLALTNAQLDLAWARASEIAAAEFRGADDIRLTFAWISLDDDASLDYQASSQTVGRTTKFTIHPDREIVWARTNRFYALDDITGPIWREDDSWRDLARKASLREGRGVSMVVYPRPGVERIPESESRWWILCKPDDSSRPENHYTLRNGRLEEY
jgi:hypothetical protein